MRARIENPALSVPGALEALQELGAAATKAEIPETTLYMAQLRASQINGCSVCVDIHSRELEHAGESSERIHTVVAWREAPYFSDAERAALALTEAATRLADHRDPVPDEIWDEAARYYSERQLAALAVAIAAINAYNRLNVMTRQVGGEWVERALRPELPPAAVCHGGRLRALRAGGRDAHPPLRAPRTGACDSTSGDGRRSHRALEEPGHVPCSLATGAGDPFAEPAHLRIAYMRGRGPVSRWPPPLVVPASARYCGMPGQ